MQFQSHDVGGQAFRNTIHVRKNPSSGVVDAGFLTGLGAASGTTSLSTAYRGILTTAQRLDGILLRATRDPSNPDAERDEFFLVVDALGTRSNPGTTTPLELGAILKLSGDLAGRRYRGKIWLPPIMDPGQVTGENRSTGGGYSTAIASFITELTKTTYPSGAGHYGGSWNDSDLCVFSRRARLAGSTYYARVSGLSSPTKLRWLRSRNPVGQ